MPCMRTVSKRRCKLAWRIDDMWMCNIGWGNDAIRDPDDHKCSARLREGPRRVGGGRHEAQRRGRLGGKQRRFVKTSTSG